MGQWNKKKKRRKKITTRSKRSPRRIKAIATLNPLLASVYVSQLITFLRSMTVKSLLFMGRAGQVMYREGGEHAAISSS